MQNFSRFSFDVGIEFASLRRGEKLQDAFGDGWTDPKHFQRGDDPVATEDGAEPGDTSIRVIFFWIAKCHHFNIGCGTLDPVVEAVVGAGN